MRKLPILILALALLAATSGPAFAADRSPVQDFLASEAFAQLVIGLAALALATIRLRLSDRDRKIMDIAIGIANQVEKGIADDTDSPTMSKIDKALQRFQKEWAKATKQEPSAVILDAARGAIERWVADRNAGRPL